MTPGWLRTVSRRMAGGVSADMGGLLDHVAVGGAWRHHGVDVGGALDGHAQETGARCAERARECSERLARVAEIVGGDAEATCDRGEIGLGMKARRVVAAAVEELLLLAHQPEVA